MWLRKQLPLTVRKSRRKKPQLQRQGRCRILQQLNRRMPQRPNRRMPQRLKRRGSAAVEAQDAATVGYLEQGYYIVQKGDSLASICRKIYQTTAMMDKICEINGIDDPDSIYAGQYLTLPN